MIDTKFSMRLDELEQERHRLIGQAAGYRLKAFDAIVALAPQAAKVDMARAVIRYAREHWAITGTLIALAGLALRKRIGMPSLAQLALRLGGHLLAP